MDIFHRHDDMYDTVLCRDSCLCVSVHSIGVVRYHQHQIERLQDNTDKELSIISGGFSMGATSNVADVIMERSKIIADLKIYFKISELVCPHVLKKFGDDSWQFLDTALLETLLALRRDILRVPMVVNSGSNTQRGLRCNRCNMVKSKLSVYVSAHVLGRLWM